MAESSKRPVIDPIYQKFVKGIIRAVGSTDFYEYFMDSVSRAENEFQFSNRKMIKTVDITWVDAIEKALDHMQNIIASPRNVIKEEEVIVNIANAKRSNSETVRHLAQHTSYIDDFNEQNGNVRPGKLMQKLREDSLDLYENRLVYTTVEYAYRFVKIRYDALTENMNDEFGAKLKISTDMNSPSEEVHLDMFLHIKEIESTLETDEKNSDIFARIARIYRILSVFINSPFAQQMSKFPLVKGAIHKTNILKKNRDYKEVLALFEFLRHYTDIGYAIRIVEQNPDISEAFQRDIFHNIMFNYLILKGYLEDEADRKLPEAPKGRKRTLKPKFIHEIVEELTENYDLPDIEVRKVLIEELTKEQLMQEEAAERRRLVEEQARRKKEEEERIRAAKKAEADRIKAEKAAERERLRLEKEAEEQRKRAERMELEIEDRRRSGIFKKELKRFTDNLEERLAERKAADIKYEEELKRFNEAVRIAQETELRQKQQAEREAKRTAEEAERLRIEKERAALEEAAAKAAERERILREKQEMQARAEALQKEKDEITVKPIVSEIVFFTHSLQQQLEARAQYEEDVRLKNEERERERKERLILSKK